MTKVNIDKFARYLDEKVSSDIDDPPVGPVDRLEVWDVRYILNAFVEHFKKNYDPSEVAKLEFLYNEDF